MLEEQQLLREWRCSAARQARSGSGVLLASTSSSIHVSLSLSLGGHSHLLGQRDAANSYVFSIDCFEMTPKRLHSPFRPCFYQHFSLIVVITRDHNQITWGMIACKNTLIKQYCLRSLSTIICHLQLIECITSLGIPTSLLELLINLVPKVRENRSQHAPYSYSFTR